MGVPDGDGLVTDDLRVRIRYLHTSLYQGLVKSLMVYCMDTAVLPLGAHAVEEQVHLIIDLQRPQRAYPAEREQTAFNLLESIGKARRRDSKAHHIIILINNNLHEFRGDEREIPLDKIGYLWYNDNV